MAKQGDLPFSDYIPPLLSLQLAPQPPPQQKQQLRELGDQGHELSSHTDAPVNRFLRPLPPQLLKRQPRRRVWKDPDIHEYAQSAIARLEEAERQILPQPHQQRQEAPQAPSTKLQQQSRRRLSLPARLPQQNEEQSENMTPQDLPPQLKSAAEPRHRGSTSLKLKQAVQRVRSRKESKQPPGFPQTSIQLENSWARMYVENVELKRLLKRKETAIKKKDSQVQNNESLLAKATYTMAHLHHENMQLHRQSAQTTPLLRGLEDALSDNISQFSLKQEEFEDESARNTHLIQKYAAAKREATDLRCLNNTLVNHLTQERKNVTKAEAQLNHMKVELDSVVEERLRVAVLEAENEALRNDLTAGMEQMIDLAQVQQQMSIDLNSEDMLRWEEQQTLDRRRRDQDNVPLGIKIRFRGDSIWDPTQAGPRREGEVYANAGIEMASRGTETTPFPSPFLGASPVTVLAATAPSSPSPTAPVVTTESPQRSPPPSPPLLLTAPTPPFPPAGQQRTPTTPTTPIKPPRFLGTHTHTNTYIHTHTQTQTLTTEKKAEIFLLATPPPLLHSFNSLLLLLQSFSSLMPLLPLLPLLLATFFLARCADRLTAEREIWRAANEVAREKVVQWNTEWWGGRAVEWAWWEFGQGMLG